MMTQFGSQRSSCGHDSIQLQLTKVEVLHNRIFNKIQYDRGHDGCKCDLMVDQGVHKASELVPRHGYHLPFIPKGSTNYAGDAIDVKERHQA
ncbi:hypothetical protein AKJ16_DCAP10918 [Drosera capensis]